MELFEQTKGLPDWTGKMRMTTAMRLGVPDRVPVMCQLSLGHYFLQAGSSAVEIWHSSEAFAAALIELQRRYGFDGILVNLPGRDPEWQRHIQRAVQDGRDTVIHWKNGWFTVCPPDDNPHVYREDGSRFVARLEQLDPDRLYYVEPHDISGVSYPYCWGFDDSPADPSRFFPPHHFSTVEAVIRDVGRQVSIHGEVFSPFSQLLELIRHEDALIALAEAPEKVEACLSALTQGTIEFGRGLAARGVDAVLVSSAFSGAGFISLEHYRRFVLPYERRVVEGIKAGNDVAVYTHTCGRIGDRLELMMETGTDGIDTLDPPPLGNVDLADAKRRVGHRLFIRGNIDPVSVLLRGSPKVVRAAARRCIEAAGAGGGYVLSSACSVPPSTPPENLAALVEVARESGLY